MSKEVLQNSAVTLCGNLWTTASPPLPKTSGTIYALVRLDFPGNADDGKYFDDNDDTWQAAASVVAWPTATYKKGSAWTISVPAAMSNTKAGGRLVLDDLTDNMTPASSTVMAGGCESADILAALRQANLTQIDSTALASATLNLTKLNIVNSGGDAIVASSTGSNGNGINASGNGSGNGAVWTGGATGNGALITGGATSGSAMKIAAGATTGIGLECTGTGALPGGKFFGGSGGGAGLQVWGGSGGGIGLYCLGQSNNPAIQANGHGTAAGLKITGGATGQGALITGGSTSGSALKIVADGTNDHALECVAIGTGHGALLQSGAGATGNGLQCTALSTAGNGAAFLGTTSGRGLLSTGGNAASGAAFVAGGGNGDGITCTPQGTGAGLAATISPALATGTNVTDAVTAIQGTSGIDNTELNTAIGGLSGWATPTNVTDAVTAIRGALGTETLDTLAADIAGTLSANLTQIDGVSLASATLNLKKLNIVNDSGSAIVASSTGSNGVGIEASGNGSGAGLKATGGTTGHGIHGAGGTGGTTDGLRVTGGGFGRGLYVQGGATGRGAFITAGGGDAAGVYVGGQGTGAGAQVVGGPTGVGTQITGGVTSGVGLQVTSQNNNDNAINTTPHGTGSGLAATITPEIGGGTAPTVEEIADQVWTEALAGHLTSGSTGEALGLASGGGAGIRSVIVHVENELAVAVGDVSVGIYDSSNTNLVGMKDTDAAGDTTAFFLNDGTYKVRLQKSGYTAVLQTIVVSEDATHDLEVTAPVVPAAADPALCTVYGYMLAADGTPTASEVVTFKVSTPEGVLPNLVVSEESTVTTDATGYFEIDLIRGATVRVYSVKAELRGVKITIPDAASAALATLI